MTGKRSKRRSSAHKARAQEAGGIHSNAYNFLSAVNTGVDPRTGMYSASISLPGVAANNLCGPTLGLSVSFSALNPVDAGFGIGWSLTATRYDTRRKRLSLSSGESFLVDDFDVANDTARFKDRKLRSFDLIRVGLAGDFRIVHKAGHAEHLKVLPGSDGVAVLQEVRSPEGYVVALDQGAAGGIVKLRAVTDGTGRVLLSVAYGIADTRVTLHPDTPQAVSFTFHFSNDWLTRLDLPEGYGDGWAFGYEERHPAKRSWWQRVRGWLGQDDSPRAELGLLLLKSVVVPTGGREEATYKHDGHVLPGGTNRPLSHMPYVTRFQRIPGHDQPVMDTRYEYSKRNFFGYDVLGDWLDDEDNLYRVVMPVGQHFEYSSTERQYDGSGPVRTIVRTFNRFHLMTSEQTSQEGCIKEVVTKYDDDPSTSFANQVPWCQLPSEVLTTFSYEDRAGSCTVRQGSTYDEHGNVTSRIDERGAKEIFTYYPVEGVEGECPADPLGFVRFLREKLALPPDGSDGPVRLTRFVYEKLPSRIEGDDYHIASAGGCLHERYADGRLEERGRTSQTFVDDGGDFHGRSHRVASYHLGVEQTAEYTYRLSVPERDARGDVVPTLVTETTKTWGRGAARLQTNVSVALSLQSGLPVMDQGPDGGIMRYAYDHLGRELAQVVAADSDFEATTTSHYVLGYDGSGFGKTSVKGLYTYVALDGFGSPVSAFVRDWNGDGQDHPIWEATFDGMGRKISETTRDAGVPVARNPPPYDEGENVPVDLVKLALKTTYRYDGWGTCVEVAESNGSVACQSVDPVRRVAESWNESMNVVGRRRGNRTRTTSTISGKPWTVEVLDAAEVLLSRREHTYDGLDRLVTEVASAPGYPDKVTTYRYDFYDRLIETTLPDGAVVTQEYAGDTPDPRVTAVSIRHPTLGNEQVRLGQQAYDSLGRRTWLRVGQRETKFAYTAASSIDPDTTLLPSGTSITCGYERRLGGRLTWQDVGGERVDYAYDKASGDLISASNALGSHELTYDPSGKLATQTFRYDGTVRVDHHTYTLRGSPTWYAIDGGDEQHMIYDRLGRLSRVEGSDVVVDFTYDDFAQRSGTLSRSRDGTRSMDVRLSLDEDGRELKRVIVARAGDASETHTLIPSYTPDGKLATRQLVTDDGGREETFGYDLRGRLDHYTCTGIHGPCDASGRVLASQGFTYDALDNVRRLETAYVGGDIEIHLFHYRSDDPTQLDRIEQEGHPEHTRHFSYDRAGNLEQDESGRTLLYEGLGRPAGWLRNGGGTVFRYGPRDRIVRVDDGIDTRYRYYGAEHISLEAGTLGSSCFTGGAGGIVAQTNVTAESRKATLLGADALGSTIIEVGEMLTRLAYTPHGYRKGSAGVSDIGYAGELKERGVDWYVLGHYRAYNPVLLRFHSPDAASPFGHGGLNAYTYCLGDPINRSDPTGEGLAEWIFAGIGLLAAGVAMILSAGTLGPAFGAALTLSANLTQSTALALLPVELTGVGFGFAYADAVDRGNDVQASTFSVVSMMLGLAGLAGSIVTKGAAKVASEASSAVVDTSRRSSTASTLGWLEGLSSSPPLKPPTLIRSPPRLRLLGGAPDEAIPSMRSAASSVPGAGGSGTTGVQRINLAVRLPHYAEHLISKGLLSRELLNRFPAGIVLGDGRSVAYARMQLSRALAGMDGLHPEMVYRSGFKLDDLIAMDPNGPAVRPGTGALSATEADMYLRIPASRLGGSTPGEAIFRVFLQTRSIKHLKMYALAELQARGSGNWSRWYDDWAGF